MFWLIKEPNPKDPDAERLRTLERYLKLYHEVSDNWVFDLTRPIKADKFIERLGYSPEGFTQLIDGLVASLPKPRAQVIVNNYFGLGGCSHHNYREIGEMLKVSHSWVGVVLRDALLDLRKALDIRAACAAAEQDHDVNPWLCQPFTALDLSTKTDMTLRRRTDIATVADLLALANTPDLERIYTLGVPSIEEILWKLKRCGLLYDELDASQHITRDMSIRVLGLPYNIFDALWHEEIQTVGVLLNCYQNRYLRSLHGFGKVRVRRIRDALFDRNLIREDGTVIP